MTRYVLAVDEGTTGVRALIFDERSRLCGAAYEEIGSSFPRHGWMEQDAEAIWQTTRRVIGAALQGSGLRPADLSAVGVTNQRATTLVWERASGRPLGPAISWQDGRTAERSAELLGEGIFLNSMASATKLEWLVHHTPGAAARAAAGELCFGTIDTWLVWRLSGGRAHVTDHSNASCTGLYDFMTGEWSTPIVEHLRLSPSLLPSIRSSSELYAETDSATFGAAVPVAGIAGDQQAAMFGELGVDRAAVKITFGTSAMVDINVGEFPTFSQHGAYPLVLWALHGQRTFCLEGTVITAGAAVQWLRDGLGVLSSAKESAALAASVPDTGGVWAVPAFQGLGTPYLDPDGRAVIGGISRGTTRAHIVRAVLEGIAFRSRQALQALLDDMQAPAPAVLRVDGGAAANDFLLQSVADVLGRPVERPETVQASALGTAYLAGIACGVWSGIDELRDAWRSGGVFEPRWSEDERQERFARWHRAADAAKLGGL
jgi:glycerol kinase